MNSQSEEFDSDLQKSLQQFDQAANEQHSGSDDISDDDENDQEQSHQQDNDEQQENQDEEEGKQNKKNKKDQKQNQQDKRDYYAEYLKPDQQVQSNAPFTVVVHGSKKSGKSSLIRSLIKHYTKHKIDQIQGTITLRSNKKQRVTIIQCGNDICQMMDLAKIADIVLLVIDASLGFEMQTFQFLSLLKSHGFPHVIGVLTHLDFFKDNKQLKKTKKKFKKRFQYEVGGNYKLFNLARYDNGLYQKIQTAKIARYIGTSKPPQIPWRSNHPYIIADRWQTVQDNQYSKEDELDVSFYGYIRGSSYRLNSKIHIVGVGDYTIKTIQKIMDPCPEYKKQNKKQEEQQKLKGDQEIQDQEEQLEPVAKTTPIKRKRRSLNQQERIIYAPACNLGTMNFDHSTGFVTIPHDYVKFTRINEQENQDDLQQGIKLVRKMQDLKQSMNQKLRKRQGDFQLFQGIKMQGDEEFQDQNVQNQFKEKQKQIRKLKKQAQNIQLVNPYQEDDVHRKDDLQFLIYESKQKMNTHDCSKYHPQGVFNQQIKLLFVTGMEEDVLKQMNDSDQENQQKKQEIEIKKVMNQNFVKASMNQQLNFYQKGEYVRITLSGVKYSLFQKFSYANPMILTRVNLGQDNFGFLKIRFKRHRWYSNLLKSNDPIIVSSGWRRYQSMVVFATQDPNQRMRFLKYTPKYDFCTAILYGNFVQQNSGIMFSQTVRNDLKKFRIAASGIVLEINKSYEVMKKIKLIGQPYKIMKNTAFIKNMFNSSMEVANYIGAQIRTVSGIRGQVKKIIKDGGQGTFRATFQDKISISDIVFCRAWYKIILERYCNPVLTYDKKRYMKTKYELRMEKGVQAEKKPDSEYKTIDRAPKVFNPFMMPKKLESKLPFKTSQKIKQSKKEQIRRKQSQNIPKILMSDKQREVASLIQRLNTIRNQKQQKQDAKFKQKRRIQAARQKPKQQYYDKLKKMQKSQKMAAITRNKNKSQKKRRQGQDQL